MLFAIFRVSRGRVVDGAPLLRVQWRSVGGRADAAGRAGPGRAGPGRAGLAGDIAGRGPGGAGGAHGWRETGVFLRGVGRLASAGGSRSSWRAAARCGSRARQCAAVVQQRLSGLAEVGDCTRRRSVIVRHGAARRSATFSQSSGVPRVIRGAGAPVGGFVLLRCAYDVLIHPSCVKDRAEAGGGDAARARRGHGTQRRAARRRSGPRLGASGRPLVTT